MHWKHILNQIIIDQNFDIKQKNRDGWTKAVYCCSTVVRDWNPKFSDELTCYRPCENGTGVTVRLPSDPVIIEWTMAAREAQECIYTSAVSYEYLGVRGLLLWYIVLSIVNTDLRFLWTIFACGCFVLESMELSFGELFYTQTLKLNIIKYWKVD